MNASVFTSRSTGVIDYRFLHLVPPLLAPASAAIVVGCLAYICGFPPVPSAGSDTLSIASAIASIAATMLGFMLAALAVLASINHTHLVSMMKRTGHYRDLLGTLFFGGVFFLACALCGYCLLFGKTASASFMACLLAFHIGALVSLVDIGRKFWLVLTNLHPET